MMKRDAQQDVRQDVQQAAQQVVRAQYRAALKNDVTEAALEDAVSVCRRKMEKEKQEGRLLTGGMFRWHELLFLYMEYVTEEPVSKGENEGADSAAGREGQTDWAGIPEQWFPEMAPLLHTWPELSGETHWAYMYPVFWFDTPKGLETWRRKKAPDKRCGRIAVLYPEKLFSYVCHHQAIVEEGLLVGDRYQMIFLHENLLFSYFETPRDREQVNIRREEGESLEIQKWEAVDPEAHFRHFPEAGGENFLVIETVISVG